jgi:DNA-binding IclR family transcriptional regulator
MNVSNEGQPFLFYLREKTDEMVHLVILNGTEIIYVNNLESGQGILMQCDIGVRKPTPCTEEGQAILAFQPAHVVQGIVAAGHAARMPNAITSPANFSVRQRSYVNEAV